MCSGSYAHESLVMGSELIVLSSDDEDDVLTHVRPPKLHKRSKVFDTDNEVTVIEKASSCLESRVVEKNASPASLSKLLSDEDCCILNYDPENAVQVPDFQANDADDLVVVGERGPVACRDFPHARHLCVKFPFSTTSHEKYCEQCHCYVCDVIAPCLLWGQGKQSSDHCHAFDKDEKWKKMRSHARSASMKQAVPLPASIRRGQMIQPRLRTYTQPPLRVRLTTGIKGPTNQPNISANVAPVNQYWSSSSENWPSYLPSKMSMMLANGSHRNRTSIGGMSMPRAGNSYLDTNVVSPEINRRRSFSEHSNSLSNNALTTSSASQQMSYMPPLPSTPNHSSIGITQMCGPRPGVAYSSSFVDTPVQQYQEQRVVAPTVTACSYLEGMNGAAQRLPKGSNSSTLSRFDKDLVTLQGFLMQGITGQSQDRSTAHGVSTVETGCTQAYTGASGSSVLNRPNDMALNRDLESLYNPFEPSEMESCNVVGIENTSAQVANTQVGVQTTKSNGSITEPVGVMDTAEKSLCLGGGTDAAFSLDQLLAEFDDDFWTLLEPTLPAF